jgi:hypothetical protein
MASMHGPILYPLVLILETISLVTGCSSDLAQRTAYETLQNVGLEDCRKNPSPDAECPKRESYDDFQRRRKELESKRAQTE